MTQDLRSMPSDQELVDIAYQAKKDAVAYNRSLLDRGVLPTGDGPYAGSDVASAVAIKCAVIEALAAEAEAEENRYYHERKPGMQDSFAITARWLRAHLGGTEATQ